MVHSELDYNKQFCGNGKQIFVRQFHKKPINNKHGSIILYPQLENTQAVLMLAHNIKTHFPPHCEKNELTIESYKNAGFPTD